MISMKQELLTDIELDVQQMKYLIDSLSKEPTPALQALLKRNILQMRGRLDQMLSEVEAALQSMPITSIPLVEEDTLSEISIITSLIPDVIKEEASTASVVEVESQALGDSVWTSTDFRRSISLNDSFRFTRELFGGDSDLMNRVVEQISAMNTLNAAIAFLNSKVNVTEENEAMNDFLELLKKYFKSA